MSEGRRTFNDALEEMMHAHHERACAAADAGAIEMFDSVSSPGDRVERYLRVTVRIPGGVVEAGLQRLGIGEPVSILRSEYARLIAEECLALNGNDIDDASAQRITDAIEIRLLQTWPQRLWFVEFWDHHEALTQTYHPSWMRRR